MRDFIEATKRNDIIPSEKLIGIGDIGLDKVSGPTFISNNKNALIKKYPEWKEILEDPETGIKNLFAQKDIATLGKLIDTVKDDEFSKIFFKELGGSNDQINRDLIKIVLKKKDLRGLGLLSQYTFPQNGAEMKDLIAETIAIAKELKASEVLRYLAEFTFSNHGAEMKDLIRETIAAARELKAPNVLRYSC